MATLPWTTRTTTTTTEPLVVMASRLELRRRRDVPRYLVASLLLRRAFRSAPGSVGLGLAARPWAKTFWTLSSWRDQDSLAAYAATPLHREIMRRFRPNMADSTFVEWTDTGSSPPTWEDARQRIAAERSGVQASTEPSLSADSPSQPRRAS